MIMLFLSRVKHGIVSDPGGISARADRKLSFLLSGKDMTGTQHDQPAYILKEKKNKAVREQIPDSFFVMGLALTSRLLLPVQLQALRSEHGRENSSHNPVLSCDRIPRKKDLRRVRRKYRHAAQDSQAVRDQ